MLFKCDDNVVVPKLVTLENEPANFMAEVVTLKLCLSNYSLSFIHMMWLKLSDIIKITLILLLHSSHMVIF